jgi:tRNA(Ile)-lysidine synthase
LEAWLDPANLPGGPHPSLRAELRARLMPALARTLGPGVPGALARTAARLRQDNDYLDQAAAALLTAATAPSWKQNGRPAGAGAASGGEGGLELDVRRLAGAHPALRTRALRQAALRAGATPGSLAAAHIDALDALVVGWRGQGQAHLPGGIRAGRKCGKLVFRAGGGQAPETR